MALSQSTTARPSATSRPQTSMAAKRPASSMDDPFEAGGGPTEGKRQGTNSHSTSSTQFEEWHPPLQYKKLRGVKSAHTVKVLQRGISLRDVSVSTALSKLRLDDTCYEGKHGYISDLAAASLSASTASTCAAMRKSRVGNNSGTVALFGKAERNLVAPKTPSHIPISKRAEASLATPATPSKSAKYSSTKTQFLTKDSNILAFTAWDVHGRLEDMEAMYSELKKTLNGTSLERNGLEEAIAQYKARCMWWPLQSLNYDRSSPGFPS